MSSSAATTTGVGTTDALREIDTSAGTLRYYDVGQGPTVLFLHGSGPGVTGWRNFRGCYRRSPNASAAWSWSSQVSEFPTTGAGTRWSPPRAP